MPQTQNSDRSKNLKNNAFKTMKNWLQHWISTKQGYKKWRTGIGKKQSKINAIVSNHNQAIII